MTLIIHSVLSLNVEWRGVKQSVACKVFVAECIIGWLTGNVKGLSLSRYCGYGGVQLLC